LDINELYNNARQGDEASERRLFVLLSERFAEFAHRRVWNEQDARDVVQEALLTITREYRSLKVETSFAAWAYKVLDNRILAYIKSKRVRDGRMAGDAALERMPARPDENPTLRTRLLECLRKIHRRSPRHVRVLNLRYQGYTTEEICERMKISRNALYILMCRVRAMLDMCLNAGDDDE